MRVMLLMPTTTYRADDFLAAAQALGVEVVTGWDRCHVIAGLWPTDAVALEFADPAGAARTIAEQARGRPLHAIVPTDDATTVIAALAARELGLRHNPVEAAQAARNKRLSRERLRDEGLPVPRFTPARTGEDAQAIAARIGFPCVIKPLVLSASRGVIRADDLPSLTAALRRLSALLRSPAVAVKRDHALEEILVEEFIPGREVALEGLLEDGALRALALFDKPDPLDGPFFEETLYVTPSRLPPAGQEAIVATVGRAARALGLREGPVHAELRVNDRGAWILEVAARSIGGLCSRALRFGAGVSLEELILRHACGMAHDMALQSGGSGVMMLPIPRRGVLHEVRGLDDARAVPGVEQIALTARAGDLLVPLPEGASYPGFIIARGETPEAVEASLREAHRRLQLVLGPEIPIADGRPRP